MASTWDELGLRDTGRREEAPESPVVAAELGEGWHLVLANSAPRVMCAIPRARAYDDLLGRLSLACEIVTCEVEEHVMYSAASGWKEGRMIWSVSHDSERGEHHLETLGELPAAFEEIRARSIAKQQTEGVVPVEEGVTIQRGLFVSRTVYELPVDHIFGIPVELAQSLTGFRHDRAIRESHTFVVLEPTGWSLAKVLRLLFFRDRGLAGPV